MQRFICTPKGKSEDLTSYNMESAAVLECVQQDGPIGITEVAHSLSMNSQTVTGIFKGLLKEKLIESEYEEEPEHISERPRRVGRGSYAERGQSTIDRLRKLTGG